MGKGVVEVGQKQTKLGVSGRGMMSCAGVHIGLARLDCILLQGMEDYRRIVFFDKIQLDPSNPNMCLLDTFHGRCSPWLRNARLHGIDHRPKLSTGR